MIRREAAIEIARRCARSKPQSYYAEPFQPHEWVIDAIMELPDPADVVALELLTMHMRDVVNALLDALSMPDGRNVAKAWSDACLMFGRFGNVMKRASFEQYLDELAKHGGSE